MNWAEFVGTESHGRSPPVVGERAKGFSSQGGAKAETIHISAFSTIPFTDISFPR